ncbi:xylulokinase [Halalkalibacterium halodurans]|uniref:Xylulose kinase n=3 Tax=Halalkalibacterium halodurans TaxID=86665 RepID=A0A0M0KI81_ALKHA|nr:xylulokinase [Halalkalibacterium halodurans]MED3647956.1 xylulokinase [Halalkalibacterium halodurans]TPE68936.1 xylulokinase [Halalkalibacterium halodurans]
MRYVLGVDLGTSAVKVLLVNERGEVCKQVTKSYPLYQDKPGYSEQDPEDWLNQTIEAISQVTSEASDPEAIDGISFSGQMHGLVLLDQEQRVLRPAILWNDTRTTNECREIEQTLGKEPLLSIAKNPALEGFTLPKLLWVKKYEPDVFARANVFMLPKDYVRFRLTGKIHSEYSDAAGTLLFDVAKKEWSKDICSCFELPISLCPPVVPSSGEVGELLPEIAAKTGLKKDVRVFAGGADNACGAIGAGILKDGATLCSIGTSGVVLSYEQAADQDFAGKVHYFNHGEATAYYTMGVTLAAGYSLSWFKETFAPEEPFENIVKEIEKSPPGANGLLFTPYIVGERTPHADATIRGSFIGVHAGHKRHDFTRAVIEGITFSLNESIEIFRKNGKDISTVVSIGGGAKSPAWLQLQADIFQAKVIKQSSEQGPGLGAAMLAAYGLGWYDSLADCAEAWVKEQESYEPNAEKGKAYEELFTLYRHVYEQTYELNHGLSKFRE